MLFDVELFWLVRADPGATELAQHESDIAGLRCSWIQEPTSTAPVSCLIIVCA